MKLAITTFSFAAALILVAGCRSASKEIVLAPGAGVVGAGSAAAIAAADKAANSYIQADVDFMTGMVPHHAQAILMSRMAETHGARADVKLLAQKIMIAQTAEIAMMRRWLGERNLPVPDSMSTKHVMKMGDMVHEMLMPGMLTDAEIATLDKARGSAFDRLYLTGMIRHHQGAIEMVHTLFKTPGSAQDVNVFRFASDVETDQTSEIQKMHIMLETVPPL
jgi:uncharacterized protein (DUF305 family)